MICIYTAKRTICDSEQWARKQPPDDAVLYVHDLNKKDEHGK